MSEFKKLKTQPLSDFKHLLVQGAIFRYTSAPQQGKKKDGSLYFYEGYPTTWQVREVVERGIVVSHPHCNEAHKHLIDWDRQMGSLLMGRGKPNCIDYETGLIYKYEILLN